MNNLEHEWRKETSEKVREFVKEMGNIGKCIRLGALYEQLWDAEDELKNRFERYSRCISADQPYIDRALIASFIPEIEARLEKLKRNVRAILVEAEGRTPKDRITPEMIERAKEYPIENLIGNGRRGNILCITHEEKHPSMSVKNNKARCFSCGYFGDSIDVYMKLNGSSFIEAVKALQ